MNRGLTLYLLLLLGSCAEVAGDIMIRAVAGGVGSTVRGGSKCPPNVECGPGAIEAARQRNAHSDATLAQGRALTKLALDAARVGDCVVVSRIELQVLALPEVQLEGGLH